MSTPLRVLLVEDNPNDAVLIIRELRNAGFDPTYQRVETEQDYAALLSPNLDVVLSDFELPQFSGAHALALLQERGLSTPFIVISGAIGEETAVWMMQLGAADYLLKDRLTRLGPALERALSHARNVERRKVEDSVARETIRRSSALTEHLPQVLWLADDKGERSYASAAYDRVWGRAREGIGRPAGWLDGVYFEDRERVRNAVQEMLGTGKLEISYRVVHPELGVRTIHDRGLRVSEPGRGIQFVGSAEDVTVRQQREEARYQVRQHQAAIQMSRALTDSFGALAQLAARGAAFVNAPKNGNAELERWLKELTEAAQNAAPQLSQLSAYAGKRPASLSRFDLGQQLVAIRTAWSAELGVDVQLSATADELEVFAAPDMMSELFAMLGRWLKATLAPGASVHVSLARGTDTERPELSRVDGFIALRLLCMGTRDAEPARSLEPFANTLRPHVDAGAGLTAVHGIVSQHGGTLSVTATPLGETTLEILLPEAGADPAQDERDTGVREGRALLIR